MANVERKAHVVWEGDLASGSGRLTEEDSGTIREAPVTFASRVEQPEGMTSPEELIASAHATCYAMALSNTLAEKGTPPERLTVDAVCTLDDEALRITTMDLDVRGEVPDIGEEEFEDAAREADEICPVTNALRGNVEIRLNTSLNG
ncbi:MAG TPA: OsmC family peroxiredoxin [Rubrobacteraceae bacterium]|nr:OsmC family peroxiredoxin [Rubrobacteraceae bacterium]